MSRHAKADPLHGSTTAASSADAVTELLEKHRPMTSFVESCLETVADSANAVERATRHRPHIHKLLKILKQKRNILVTTHQHPDPDALASALALTTLLEALLPGVPVAMSVKGKVGGGINEAFVRYCRLNLTPWDDAELSNYDAIVLLDTQPDFAYSPLPPDIHPTAVIDHHRRKGRKMTCPFCDIRTEVGATSSIIFSYFMETETPITPLLAATLVYAIESDLAGAAGTPGELDNVALSSLTLQADTRKLYQMRYVDLPQSYYIAYSQGLASAMCYENAIISHLDTIDSLEKPAVLADFLLRFDQAEWAFVTAVHDMKLILSLRTKSLRASASDVMKRLIGRLGEGGGHRTKAGGFINLETRSAAEIERKRQTLLRRYLRALNIKTARGQRLVPRPQE